MTSLQDRTAIIWGGAGSIGTAAARGDVQGTPLLRMPASDFVRPVVQGITGSFHTARAAARQMVEQGSGVVIELDSASGRGSGPMMGGTGAADGAKKLGATLGAPVSEEMVEGIIANLDSLRMTKKSPVTTHIAATAAFLASDHAAAITGTWINATAGMFPS